MLKILFAAFLFCFTSSIQAQFSINENHHYILRDGQPFFWLGDTAWELFHRLDREETDEYLKKRSEQGFTVIQAVVLAEMDGLHVPNAYGDTPLMDDDPSRPNEKYFQHVDYVIDKAKEYGLTIALLPTWGDKVFKSTWGTGPEIFNEGNAGMYATWLAKRYKSRTNIIWILGGDRIPRGAGDVAIWRAMGNAIQKVMDGKALISFHPQPNELGSAEWFHKDGWLSFNMFQTGHCRETAIYDKINHVYHLTPLKPVMDAEPIYEDHPVCFNAKDLGTSSAYDVRRSAYLDLFAGAHGHTYGCHDIWQMYSEKREGVNGPHIYWQEALNLPGANQMKFVKALMLSRPFLERIPDQSIVKENDLSPADRVQATRGKDYAFVYSTQGHAFTLLPGFFSSHRLRFFWYDPRTGKSEKPVEVEKTDQVKFSPPSSGYGHDWVLVIDDASRNYPVL